MAGDSNMGDLAEATGPLVRLERYWRSLARPQKLPARGEIDPNRIDDALPHAFILEKVAPGIGRMRVAGHALQAELGMEARGMPISAFFLPEARGALRMWLNQLWSVPALVDIPVHSTRSIGRPKANGRLLLLPLSDEAGETTRALGALVLDTPAGRSPRRLAIGPAESLRWEPAMRQAFTPRLVRAEDAVAAQPPHQRPLREGRPQLRLVSGGQ
ncbi:PAS domain-containing protein [Pseudoroseicyclus tamaricis]|uniref:PAS domain-containing protein n=1 Tax=Pseudoroseicyclus tamaricis TaxID=2705421 RepID=A0A6B2JRI0_9RHOB|nr:PAS domain-containing protein [Pseudoroseicyclus tamaricis]NDV00788.1 PAS domain-containing protein [Pseudoroseicyclus tamaricis]